MKTADPGIQSESTHPNYTWDEDNRLIRVDKNSVTQVEYEYETQMGLMLREVKGSSSVQLAWDFDDPVMEEDGTTRTRFYNRAPFYSVERSGSLYNVHQDALGSVRAISDESGQVVARFDLDAWGNELPSSDDASFNFNYRLVGSLGVRYDRLIGLYNFRERWYDPSLGRFISRDPIEYEGGLNLYLYVQNDPASLFDDEGLRPRRNRRRRGHRGRSRKKSMRDSFWDAVFGYLFRHDFQNTGLCQGANILYDQGFLLDPTRSDFQRFWIWRKDTPLGPAFVIYDLGQPVKGPFPEVRVPHWKIIVSGQAHNRYGDPVPGASGPAHIPAARVPPGGSPGSPPIITEGPIMTAPRPRPQPVIGPYEPPEL